MGNKIDVIEVPLSLVEPDPKQPRKQFTEESLQELADSIQKYGIISPVNVRKEGMMYIIVAGERRWRAARIAGLKTIPVKIEERSNAINREISLIENIQRENLNAIDEAFAFKELMEERFLTQEEVSEIVSKSRAYISNSLRLLSLEEEILNMVRSNEISAGHARALLSIKDKSERLDLAKRILPENLSVRDIEDFAKSKGRKRKRKKEASENQMYLDAVAVKLKDYLSTNVKISYHSDSSGVLKIDFYSDDELNRIVDLIKMNKS